MSSGPRPEKLLEQVDDAIRLMQDSPRTGETYRLVDQVGKVRQDAGFSFS